MEACCFDRLLQFVNRELDLDRQLEVYDHLDRCDICLDTVCQLSRDRDESAAHRPQTLLKDSGTL